MHISLSFSSFTIKIEFMNFQANRLTIAVDFDGTIVEDKYPGIGKPLIFAFDTLKMLQKDGHRLILWTYRHGNELTEAVDFCLKNGIEFYAVNKSYPEEGLNENTRRKLNADVFIDDRNVGGFLGWGQIYQILSAENAPKLKPKKKGFFRF